jgi:hypothetical protein
MFGHLFPKNGSYNGNRIALFFYIIHFLSHLGVLRRHWIDRSPFVWGVGPFVLDVTNGFY